MARRIPTHKPPVTRAAPARALQTERRRGSSHERGYTKRWAAYSRTRLKAHPQCEAHRLRGQYVSATCTDHIVPVSGPDDPGFWEPTNHQSLCARCHSEKTAREDGGFGNVKKVKQ